MRDGFDRSIALSTSRMHNSLNNIQSVFFSTVFRVFFSVRHVSISGISWASCSSNCAMSMSNAAKSTMPVTLKRLQAEAKEKTGPRAVA